MAIRQYGLNDAETVKLWSKKVFVDSIRETYFGRFIGADDNSAIQELPDLKKSAGDRVRTTLRAEPVADGVSGSATLEGNEEAISTYTDDLFIDELRYGVRVPGDGSIEQQRVLFDCRETARGMHTDWWKTRFEIALANQFAGNTAVSDTRYTGMNATIAPSTGRIVRAGAVANDQSLGSSNTITLNLIDKAVALLKQKDSNGNYRARGVKVGNAMRYIMFLHPNQVYNLRADATTAGNWFDIQKAALQGGDVTGNPLFDGALGMYNGVILHECESVPLGVHSSTGAAVASTRRAFILGAQAGVIAYGQGYSGDVPMGWDEEPFDYKKILGIKTGLVWGAKKTQFNSKDFSTFVISTYAAEPS